MAHDPTRSAGDVLAGLFCPAGMPPALRLVRRLGVARAGVRLVWDDVARGYVGPGVFFLAGILRRAADAWQAEGVQLCLRLGR